MKPSILFLSPMCLLDTGSGAAVSACTWLEILAAEGYRCESLTLPLFDENREDALQRFLGHKILKTDHQGKLIQMDRNGVRHSIFSTHSTIATQLTLEELTRFLAIADRRLTTDPPDIILSYGSSAYTRKLQDLARQKCRHFVFYLANAEFNDPDFFSPDDILVCPSQFLAGHYRSKLGLSPEVIPDVILPEKTIDPDSRSGLLEGGRNLGFITFINPHPTKGLALFLQLINMAQKTRPDLTFLAVEGRFTRDGLRKMKVDLGSAPNVWLLPRQKDIRPVYQRSALLLCPSFWEEASARIVAEAQLSGIPVLASRRGGIPEQLNGGGFLFDIPRRCAENHAVIPTEQEVRPWLDTICRLMDDDAAFAGAVKAARKAGEKFRFDHTRQRVVDFFDRLSAVR